MRIGSVRVQIGFRWSVEGFGKGVDWVQVWFGEGLRLGLD